MSKSRHWLAGTLIALCLAVAVNAQTVNQVVNSIVATTCTNQLVRSIAATGTATCATIASTDIAANAVTNAKLATMSAATVKGQIVAGSGDPVDMTAAQAAAVIGSVGGAVRSKLVTTSYNLTTASGSQAITGVGFVPTTCTVFAAVLGGPAGIVGFSDSSRTSAAIWTASNSVVPVWAAVDFFLQYTNGGGTDSQTATISSYDSDGLTLSWTKVGAPTGTLLIKLICFR